MYCSHSLFPPLFLRPSVIPPAPVKAERTSMGRGKMMVEFFSAEIELRVLKYHNGQFWNDAASSPEDSAAEARLVTDRWCQRPL